MKERLSDFFETIRDSDLSWNFRHSPIAICALFVTLVLMLSALFAQAIAPLNP